MQVIKNLFIFLFEFSAILLSAILQKKTYFNFSQISSAFIILLINIQNFSSSIMFSVTEQSASTIKQKNNSAVSHSHNHHHDQFHDQFYD